jgi:hypothetical protein
MKRTKTRNMHQRLHMLERRLPRFEPPPSLLEQIKTLALRELSIEDLKLLEILTRDLEAGMRRELSPGESAAVAAFDAAVARLTAARV